MFNIINGSHLSLQDILDFKQKGGSVLRSSHLGNLNLITLLLANEGIPVLLHEHLKGEMKWYRPAYMYLNEKAIKLAKESATRRRLAQINHIYFDRIPDVVKSFISNHNHVQRPSQLHWYALKNISNNFKLLSSYCLQDELTYEIINIVASTLPHLFNLYIDELGYSFELTNISFGKIKYINKKGYDKVVPSKDLAKFAMNYLTETENSVLDNGSSPEGVLIHTCLIIFLLAVIEIHKYGNAFIMHIAGKLMMNYLVGHNTNAELYQKELHTILQEVRKKSKKLIPERVDFCLIPVSHLEKLVITDVEQALLNNILLEKQQSYRLSENFTKDWTQYDLIVKQKAIYLPEQARYISYSAFNDFNEI